MSSDPETKPKIIVDDDWKSQVEKEKQAAAQSTKMETSPIQTESKPASDEPSSQTPPPASFESLVTMLFTQGMASLGQLPGEDGASMPINKPYAKFFIDTIELLGEKTKGNLNEQETSMLNEVLHALRLTFVQVKAVK